MPAACSAPRFQQSRHHGLSVSFCLSAHRPGGRGAIPPCCLGLSVGQACGLGHRARGDPPHPIRRLSLPQPCGRCAQHRCPAIRARRIGPAGRSLMKRLAKDDCRKERDQSTFPLVRAGGFASRTVPPDSSLLSSLHVHRYASHHAKETAHCAPLRDAERTPPAHGRPRAQPAPLPNPTPHPHAPLPSLCGAARCVKHGLGGRASFGADRSSSLLAPALGCRQKC
jgi:hypothetical protein